MVSRAKKLGSALEEARALLEQDVRTAAGEMLDELGATLAQAVSEVRFLVKGKTSRAHGAKLAATSLRALQLLSNIEVTLPSTGSRTAAIGPILTAIAAEVLSACRRADRMRVGVRRPRVVQKLPEILQQHLNFAAEMLVAEPVLAPSPLRRDITSWLEQEDRLAESIADQAAWRHVVEPLDLASRASESFDGPVGQPPSVGWVRQVLERALAGDTWYWGEEYPVHVQVNVRTSNGLVLVLGCRFITFNVMPPVEWDGLFAHDTDYLEWFRKKGYFVTLDDFDKLPRSRKVALTRMG